MDGGNQNGQNKQGTPEKKAQLSWSQPITTPQSQNNPNVSAKLQVPAQKPEEKNNMVRNIVIAVIVLAAIGGIWSLVASNKKADTGVGIEATTATTTAAMGSSTVSSATTQASLADGSLSIPTPQAAGLEIAVSNISVSVPTWVVIYENYNGQPGNVLGAGLFVPGRTSGAIDLLRGTLPGQIYFAGESHDDGDHMYSMDNDPAVRDANGDPVMLKFQTK